MRIQTFAGENYNALFMHMCGTLRYGMWLDAVAYMQPIFDKGLDWCWGEWGDPYHRTAQRLFDARKVTPCMGVFVHPLIVSGDAQTPDT